MLLLQESFVVLMMAHAIKGHSNCGMYTAVNGKSCFLCPPGYYKISDCNENGKPAGCMPCPDGKFQMTCNQATTCAPCASHCRWFSSVIKENCTATSDLVCECKPGYFLIDQGGGNGVCNRHGQCPPGQGVSRPGSSTADVHCEPCVRGDTFSNISSSIEQCQKCSRCFTPVKSPCTPQNDTVCSTAAGHAGDPDGLSQTVLTAVISACVTTVVVVLVGLAIWIYRQQIARCLTFVSNSCCSPVIEIEFEYSEQKDLNQFDPPVQDVAPVVIQVDQPVPGQIAQPVQDVAPVVFPVDPPVPGQIAQPVQDVAPVVIPADPPVPGHIRQPVAIRRTYVNRHCVEQPVTRDRLDNERSTEGDTESDAGPIDESDIHLNEIHFRYLSAIQDTCNPSIYPVSSNTELKQIAHGPIKPSATGQDNIAVTPNNIGHDMDQHNGTAGKNTLAIPTDTNFEEIAQYLAKNFTTDFKMFIRNLYILAAKQLSRNVPNVEAIISQVHMDNKEDVLEENFQHQIKWSNWYGRPDEKFCITFSNALRKCDANKILAELKEKFGSFFPSNSETQS